MEKTPVAYLPIGVSGCSGLLRVPAHLLSDMGSIIDMVGLQMYHTKLGLVRRMHRRVPGHVEVSLTEYGPQGFLAPTNLSFGRSQVWGREDRHHPSDFPFSVWWMPPASRSQCLLRWRRFLLRLQSVFRPGSPCADRHRPSTSPSCSPSTRPSSRTPGAADHRPAAARKPIIGSGDFKEQR